MKIALIVSLFILAQSGSAFASQLTCTSDDFDPETKTGHGLKLTFDTEKKLTVIEKLPGSAFSEEGRIYSPILISEYKNFKIFDANFSTGEVWGRLIVPGPSELLPSSVHYSFSDGITGVTKRDLGCIKYKF
jgi:hypothetical protein